MIVVFTVRSYASEALQNAAELEGLRQDPFSLPPLPLYAFTLERIGGSIDASVARALRRAIWARLPRSCPQGCAAGAALWHLAIAVAQSPRIAQYGQT